MRDKDSVINIIYDAFAKNEYPGDDYLIGSREGSEPFEEIEPFIGKSDWTAIDSKILDRHSGALNFFSEAGLRFFLPAYLIADLNTELFTADPLFTLTHGFNDVEIEHEIESRVFIRKTGKSAFVNPLRYGAMTFFDYARFRLSVFSREEAKPIVTYLRYKLYHDEMGIDKDNIESALDLFWLERVENAPTTKTIRIYLNEEQDYLAALDKSFDDDDLSCSMVHE